LGTRLYSHTVISDVKAMYDETRILPSGWILTEFQEPRRVRLVPNTLMYEIMNKPGNIDTHELESRSKNYARFEHIMLSIGGLGPSTVSFVEPLMIWMIEQGVNQNHVNFPVVEIVEGYIALKTMAISEIATIQYFYSESAIVQNSIIKMALRLIRERKYTVSEVI